MTLTLLDSNLTRSRGALEKKGVNRLIILSQCNSVFSVSPCEAISPEVAS
jgi:hypothetical protein